MRSQKVRWGLTFLILIMAVFIGHRVYTHMEKTAPPAVHSSTEIRPADAWIQGFTYRQTQAGVAKWEVLAKRARVIQAANQAFLEEVTVHLFEKDEPQMTVEADRGTINTKSKNIDLTNQKDFLSVRLNNGYTIYSKHLQWDESSREVKSGTPVVIKGKGLTVTGTGLVGNVDEQEFQILSNVRAEVSS